MGAMTDDSDDGSKDPSLNAMPSSPGSESEVHGSASASASDWDTSLSKRPCKILALSLANDQARAGIEQKSALNIGTLENNYTLPPRSKAFHFTN